MNRRSFVGMTLAFLTAPVVLASEGQPACAKCVKLDMRGRTCRKCFTSEADTKESYVSMSNCEPKKPKKDEGGERRAVLVGR